jgi:hypothetical protein
MAKTAIVKQGTKRQPEPLRRYGANAEGMIELYAALACGKSDSEAGDKLRAKLAAKEARLDL